VVLDCHDHRHDQCSVYGTNSRAYVGFALAKERRIKLLALLQFLQLETTNHQKQYQTLVKLGF